MLITHVYGFYLYVFVLRNRALGRQGILLSMNVTDRTRPSNLVAIPAFGVPIVTILVNVPVIFLVITSTCFKKPVKNVHLLSVGITDMLVGIGGLLLADTYMDRRNNFSYYNCCIRYYCFSITFVASMLHVLGICGQRVSIVFRKDTPQQHERYRRLAEWLVIALSWIVSVLVNVIPFGLWVTYREIDHCSFENVHDPNTSDISLYLGTLYCCIIVMVLMAMGILLFKIYCNGRFNTNQTAGAQDDKMCVSILIMAFLFVVTTSPLAFILIIYGDDRSRRSRAVLISLINSTINPFVYLYRIKEYRNKLRKAICCYSQSLCCKPSSVNVESSNPTNVT